MSNLPLSLLDHRWKDLPIDFGLRGTGPYTSLFSDKVTKLEKKTVIFMVCEIYYIGLDKNL